MMIITSFKVYLKQSKIRVLVECKPKPRHIIMSKLGKSRLLFFYPDCNPDDSQNLVGSKWTKTHLLIFFVMKFQPVVFVSSR